MSSFFRPHYVPPPPLYPPAVINTFVLSGSNESWAERGRDTDRRLLRTSRGKWKNGDRGLSINGCSRASWSVGYGQVQVRKINRCEHIWSSALLPALKEKASSQGCGAGTENLGHSAPLWVNMGPALRPLVKMICPSLLLLLVLLQTSIQPHDAWVMSRRCRVHCRHLPAGAAMKRPSSTDHLAGHSDCCQSFSFIHSFLEFSRSQWISNRWIHLSW